MIEKRDVLERIFNHWFSISTCLGDHPGDCEYFISAVKTAIAHNINEPDVSNYFSEKFPQLLEYNMTRFQGMISAIYHYNEANPWNLNEI